MTQVSIALALAGIGFLMTLIWGGPFIRVLRRNRIAEQLSAINTAAGIMRVGTPTMGGVIVVLPIALLTILLNAASLLGLTGVGRSVLLPVLALIVFGTLGLVLDWLHIRNKNQRAVVSRWNFLIQIGFALTIAFGLWLVLDVPELFLPFYKGEFELNAWFIVAALVWILAGTRGFDLTVGVDGLPGLIAATGFVAYGTIAIFQNQIFLARFCFTVTGSLLGFLWFNIYPADVLLGKTGTYGLGAALSTVALMTGQWPLLILIAIIPFAELVSAGMHKLNLALGGSGLLRTTPLHRHFSMVGWSETQILQRFWLVNFLFATIGITLAQV